MLPGLTGFSKFEQKGGKDSNGDGDYCYDPNFYQKAAESDPNWFDTTPVIAKALGADGCTSTK